MPTIAIHPNWSLFFQRKIGVKPFGGGIGNKFRCRKATIDGYVIRKPRAKFSRFHAWYNNHLRLHWIGAASKRNQAAHRKGIQYEPDVPDLAMVPRFFTRSCLVMPIPRSRMIKTFFSLSNLICHMKYILLSLLIKAFQIALPYKLDPPYSRLEASHISRKKRFL